MALRQGEAGAPIEEICRKMGVSEATYFRWKKKYGGLGIPELRELRQLRDENKRLKGIVADLWASGKRAPAASSGTPWRR
jgi:putative transposase